jgi:hypothetical protein
MRWQAITLIVWAGLLAGCDNAQRQPQGAQPLASQESERLNQWFDARFEEQLICRRLLKTFNSIGIEPQCKTCGRASTTRC